MFSSARSLTLAGRRAAGTAADELIDQLKAEAGDQVSRATVYRALEELVEFRSDELLQLREAAAY